MFHIEGRRAMSSLNTYNACANQLQQMDSFLATTNFSAIKPPGSQGLTYYALSTKLLIDCSLASKLATRITGWLNVSDDQ